VSFKDLENVRNFSTENLLNINEEKKCVLPHRGTLKNRLLLLFLLPFPLLFHTGLRPAQLGLAKRPKAAFILFTHSLENL